jgi:hypothetical protein
MTVQLIRKLPVMKLCTVHGNRMLGLSKKLHEVRLHGPKYAQKILLRPINISASISLTNYGVEPFLRSRQLCSYSSISQYFMESEGSLPCSQEPSTGPYPQTDQYSPYHPILSL